MKVRVLGIEDSRRIISKVCFSCKADLPERPWEKFVMIQGTQYTAPMCNDCSTDLCSFTGKAE